jgi:hypothetical protein
VREVGQVVVQGHSGSLKGRVRGSAHGNRLVEAKVRLLSHPPELDHGTVLASFFIEETESRGHTEDAAVFKMRTRLRRLAFLLDFDGTASRHAHEWSDFEVLPVSDIRERNRQHPPTCSNPLPRTGHLR